MLRCPSGTGPAQHRSTINHPCFHSSNRHSHPVVRLLAVLEASRGQGGQTGDGLGGQETGWGGRRQYGDAEDVMGRQDGETHSVESEGERVGVLEHDSCAVVSSLAVQACCRLQPHHSSIPARHEVETEGRRRGGSVLQRQCCGWSVASTAPHHAAGDLRLETRGDGLVTVVIIIIIIIIIIRISLSMGMEREEGREGGRERAVTSSSTQRPRTGEKWELSSSGHSSACVSR
eukprot:1903718-Rhodomonas_salina.2